MTMDNPYYTARQASNSEEQQGIPVIKLNVTPLPLEFAEAMAEQIGLEIYSQLLYWKLSASMDLFGYVGASKYFETRYNEERAHAEKFFAYLKDKQVNFNLPGIVPITVDVRDIRSAFEAALNHEVQVTRCLTSLYEHPQIDPISKIFMQFFLLEQIEEESTLKNVLDRLECANNNSSAILLIDNTL
jgi:ferritin